MSALTDAEMDALSRQGTDAPAAGPQGSLQPSAAPLTDAQMDALGAHDPMGIGEAAGRSFYKHLTFGTEPGADRAKSEQAASDRPFVNLGAGAGAMLAQTAALGPVAGYLKGVQGLNWLGRGLEAGLLPNTAADTALTAGRTASKLVGNYSGLEAFGHAATEPGKDWSDVAKETALQAAVGYGLGFPLGVGAHGASRAVGAIANRALPALREVQEAAAAPEAQGMRDIARHARYDEADLPKLGQTLDQAATDPAIAARYKDLNLTEALKAGEPVPITGTGELKPPVVTTRNLDDLAKHAANTEGRGQNIAAEAFGSRKNEMSAQIQGDIDQLFGRDQAAGTALANQFGLARNIPSKAADAERLPGLIDQHFGSGNRAAEAEAMATQKQALSARYDRLRKKPLQLLDPEITRVAQTVPEFQQALNYAAKNDAIRLAETGAEWKTPWSAEKIGDGLQTLSPTNILDIHHALVMNAKPPITGATPESMMAGKLKTWFSKWVDQQFKGHAALKDDYAVFKQMMEAQDHAAKLPLTGGSTPALGYLEQITRDYQAAARTTQAQTAAYDRGMARYQAGQNKRLPAATKLNDAIAAQDARADVVGSFRKAWGEAIKQQLGGTADHSKFVRDALTPEGQRRIVMALGEREGRGFLNQLTTIEARNQGMNLGLSAGGSDHAALQFFNRAAQTGDADAVAAFRQAWGDRIKQELASAPEPNAIVRKLLTQQGKSRILQILGDEDGKAFIESLYNKQLQTRLGNTLYGGSDTAFKLKKGEKMEALTDAIHGALHLRPLQVWQAARELGSSHYRQQRADQLNELLSQQGVDNLQGLLRSLNAQNALRRTAHPYMRNPVLRWPGPLGTSVWPSDRERP